MQPSLHRFFVALGVTAALSLFTACPGRLDDPDRFLDSGIECTDDWVENQLFAKKCATAGCHSAADRNGELDLATPGMLERLRGPSTCDGHPLRSFMLEKLDPNPACNGAVMPLGGKALKPAERECLLEYLEQLTPDAGHDAGVADAGMNADGGADAGNQPPNVAATITAPTTAIAGQIIDLSITATDPDGDTLTYTWSQPTPATKGTWSRTTGSSVTWYSPVVSTNTAYSLSVSVSDGHSTPVVRTAMVTVGASHLTDVYSAFMQPICLTCHGVAGSLTLGASASTAYTAIVGVAHHRGAACTAATNIITAGDPAHSLMYLKLGGVDAGLPSNGDCGAQMPRGGNPLPANQLIMLESWIRAGARND